MKTMFVMGVFICGVSTWWCTQADTLLPAQSDGVAQVVGEQSAAKKAQDEKAKTLSDFMRKKLKASNEILEGLVTDDLRMVSKACDALLEMSTAEKWRASNDMMYLQHSDEFRSSVRNLNEKARSESIDGAALAWMDVTMNCIKCHEWVRNVMIAELPSR